MHSTPEVSCLKSLTRKGRAKTSNARRSSLVEVKKKFGLRCWRLGACARELRQSVAYDLPTTNRRLRRLFMPRYGVHVNKYYIPEDVPQWAKLNVKQASKKIAKNRAKETKQALGKKAKVAAKLANRKGGRGKRNPANKDFKKNLKVAKDLKKKKRSGRQAKRPGT